jgi:serine acetyltransferase/thymidylate kinase
MAQALFDFFERNAIAYCVLGDTRGYPETIASDVDVVVRRDAFTGMPRVVAQFCREHDLHLVQLIRHEQTAIYFVLAWVGKPGKPDFLAVDVCSDYRRSGRLLLTADELLERPRPATLDSGATANFPVPSADLQFLYYLMKKIDKQDLRDDHGDYLSKRLAEDPDNAWRGICRFWTDWADAKLLGRAAANGEWSAVRTALPRLRRVLHRAAPMSLAGALGEVRRLLARALQPTGMIVAFLGCDGSGKTSVVERVVADFAPAFRRTGCFHLRPRLFAGSKTAALPVMDPHALRSRGAFASLAKLAYFTLDYMVGYALRVRPLAIRSTLIVFDRYFHDLLVDPRRYRYGASMTVVRWMAKCIPGPDLWVLLDAPGPALQSRKGEVSAAESERQRRAYLELGAHLRNAAIVDASRELPQVVAEVESALLRALEGRLEYRYPQLQIERNPLTTRLLLFFCRRKVPLMSKLFRVAFNCDIHCRIHSPIYLAHPYGIIIHGDTVIGRRVTIMQQVTLGAKDRGMHAAPVIEDDVYIGAGAKVLGALRVGRGAVIGANAVVTRDVPPYSTVVGANRIICTGASGNSNSRANRSQADARASLRKVVSA